MNLEMRLRPGDDVRFLWLLTICVLIAGSYYVQTRYQTAIAASHDQTDTMYRQTVADMRIVREAASLRAIRARARADLARVSHDSSLSGTTADLLSMLHSSANTYATRVLAIQPDTGSTAAATGSLRATILTIRVRGKFRDILAFVEDLSHHATLIKVSDTEMALAAQDEHGTDGPHLEATIHATLYRLAIPDDKEVRVASAP